MFSHLIVGLRQAGLPTSITEYLTLLGAMRSGVAEWSVDDFYYLSRATLVKDERHLDRFDRVFAQCFKGLEPPEGVLPRELPEEWLRKLAEKLLTPEEMAKIEALGGFEALMQRLAELLAEQKERHQGGSKWIGTAGTSPFGAYGYNPEGVRIGQHQSRHRRAVKVWDKRDFRDLDDTVELGTRNLKLALRRLRRFARQGAATELDLPDTIRSTANNAGTLDLKLVPERHNAVKVLLFLDVGGSMDDFVKLSEELFSAARSEFKHLEYFYFHNFPYERVWKNNRRRHDERLSHLRGDAEVWARLQADLRRRRGDEPVRDHHAWRQCRALERRTGPDVAGAADVALHACRMVEPDAAQFVAACALDRYDQRADGGTDVSADGERHRRDGAGVEPTRPRPLSLRGGEADEASSNRYCARNWTEIASSASPPRNDRGVWCGRKRMIRLAGKVAFHHRCRDRDRPRDGGARVVGPAMRH